MLRHVLFRIAVLVAGETTDHPACAVAAVRPRDHTPGPAARPQRAPPRRASRPGTVKSNLQPSHRPCPKTFTTTQNTKQPHINFPPVTHSGLPSIRLLYRPPFPTRSFSRPPRRDREPRAVSRGTSVCGASDLYEVGPSTGGCTDVLLTPGKRESGGSAAAHPLHHAPRHSCLWVAAQSQISSPKYSLQAG